MFSFLKQAYPLDYVYYARCPVEANSPVAAGHAKAIEGDRSEGKKGNYVRNYQAGNSYQEHKGPHLTYEVYGKRAIAFICQNQHFHTYDKIPAANHY